VTSVELAWPSGVTQKIAGIAANRVVAIDEARGLLPSATAAKPPSTGGGAPPR
jgi:hypothetical protein